MNERSSAFWEVFCQIFVENTEANNFPPHHFAHRSFEFFAGEFVEAKKSSGTVQTFFRLRGFSAPKTPRFAGQKHHRLRKKYQFEQGAQVFLIPIFFFGWGVDIYIYIDGGSQKKIQKDIIHPSIYAGEKDASTLHGFTASTLLEAKKRRVDPLSTKN